MKFRILFLSPFLSVFLFLLSSCGGTQTSSNPTPNVPSGTFSGTFTLYYLHDKTGVIDTSTTTLTLSMQKTGFAVTGDTSKVHAGSYGAYIVNSNYTGIDFVDKTFPASGTPAKVHLNGVYQYTFNGTIFQLNAASAYDTLTYSYNLTRTGN